MKNTAIILAAGNGTRMNSSVKKQFINLRGKPLLYYSIKAFEQSSVEEIILVTGKEDIEYCKYEIIQKYGFHKAARVIEGGSQRYISVHNGLQAVEDCENVLIHDGARPFITTELIETLLKEMQFYKALIVGVPVKDTIKAADKNDFVKDTPDRNCLWQVQTPQVFKFSLIKEAYQSAMENRIQNITDDAMVLEAFPLYKEGIKMIKGTYENIKVTTPEDLVAAEAFLEKLFSS